MFAPSQLTSLLVFLFDSHIGESIGMAALGLLLLAVSRILDRKSVKNSGIRANRSKTVGKPYHASPGKEKVSAEWLLPYQVAQSQVSTDSPVPK